MFLPFEQNVTDELLRQVGISQRMIDFAHSTTQAMIDAAAEVTPAFGRGEVIDVNGSPVELLLVKNPWDSVCRSHPSPLKAATP